MTMLVITTGQKQTWNIVLFTNCEHLIVIFYHMQDSIRGFKLNIKHIINMSKVHYKCFKKKGSNGEANMSQLVLGTV